MTVSSAGLRAGPRPVRLAILVAAAVALTGVALGAAAPDVEATPSRSSAVTRSQRRVPRRRRVVKPPPVRMPIGGFDLAWGEPGTVRAIGWTVDPDTPAPIGLWMTVDSRLIVVTADRVRTDLPPRYAALGPWHGFDVAVGAVEPGPRQVCIAGINAGAGPPLQLLGCTTVLVPPAEPLGSIDQLSVLPGERLGVRGWAVDPDNAFPVAVTVALDGVVVGTDRADRALPGLGWFFPAHGDSHAFDITVAARPGSHTVCVTSENFGGGAATVQIGCRAIDIADESPTGVVSTAIVRRGPSAAGTAPVEVSGSARDPDAGPPAVRLVARSTDLAEVEATATTGADGSLRATLALPPGSWQVCGTAVNGGNGADRDIGCAAVAVDDRRPTGRVTAVTPGPTSMRLRGELADPDGGAVTARVVVDGTQRDTVTGPDFDVTIASLPAGTHQVCVVAVDRAGSSVGVPGDRDLPCTSAALGSAAGAVGTTGDPGPRTPVGPPAGTPLVGIERDAGVSVALPDGSTLWVFGDSLARNADGSLRYFVNNTAAWSRPGQPTVTRDAVTSGRPVRFADPTPTDPACPASQPDGVFWPLSGVGVPASGGRTRVLVYLQKVCLGSGQYNFSTREVAVAEWYHDPASPPDGRAITASVIAPQIFAGYGYGSAAVVGEDGRIFVFSCALVGGGCVVARVMPADAADPASYRFFDGVQWVSSPSAAARLVTPPGVTGPDLPAASFAVTWDPTVSRFVMAYMPWPGLGDTAMVRIASSPSGPWSAPVLIHLEGCNDRYASTPRYCYAVSPQPRVSSPGQLGLGYFDQLVSVPERGGYVTVTVPFVVTVP